MKSFKLVLVVLALALVLISCGSKGTEISWTDSVENIEGVDFSSLKPGDTIDVFLPADGYESSIWGTEIYTHDSSIGTAAVHMGVIKLDKGGNVTIEIVAGQAEYLSSEQNGITSSSWGEYDLSFSIVD